MEAKMYDQAVAIVRAENKASASLLQRKLKIGYAFAASLLDIMEIKGVIGGASGARPRPVLAPKDMKKKKNKEDEIPFDDPIGHLLPPPKLKKLRTPPEAKIGDKGLSPAQERFCNLYAGRTPYFDDAARSYAVAFGLEIPTVEEEDFDNPASRECLDAMKEKKRIMNRFYNAAHMLLRKSKIQERCNEVLRSLLNDESVDGELSWLMTQRGNPSAKIAAMKEYNELKGRIIKKIKHSGAVSVADVDEDTRQNLDDILGNNG